MSKGHFTLAAAFVCLFAAHAARAQEHDAPKHEVGALFSAITLTPGSGYRSEVGGGVRFTLNLTDHVGLEAETTLFPNSGASGERRATGRAWQGLFGVKAGKRWEKWGVFAKARPGFVSFSAVPFIAATEIDTFAGRQFVSVTAVGRERQTYFSMDVGGAFEFYHSRRWLTRFDFGDTMIRYGDSDSLDVLPAGTSRTIPGGLRHNLQFTAGLGLRF